MAAVVTLLLMVLLTLAVAVVQTTETQRVTVVLVLLLLPIPDHSVDPAVLCHLQTETQFIHFLHLGHSQHESFR
jgi:hypothetical protein